MARRGKEPLANAKQKSIKNCEKSDILPYFQAKKLAHHSFMDAGRGCKTLGSKIKDFMLRAQQTTGASAYLHQFLLLPNSLGHC